MNLFFNVLMIIALLIAAAYFAMSEIALAGSRKLRLTRMAEKGDKRAKLVLGLKENPGSFFSVVQIGINAVAILGGILGEAAFTGVFEELLRGFLPQEVLTSVSFACSFVLVTLLFVMFADLIPKRVAMSRPETIAVGMVRLMQLFILVFKPLVWVLTTMSGFIMRVCGLPTTSKEKITNEDIVATVEAGVAAGLLDPQEQNAITNVMDLESRLVPSAMTARDSIVFFDANESYESITKKIRENPHDKFLVCDKTIDKVVGVVDSKELLKKYADGKPFVLKDSGLITPVIAVPDSPVDDVERLLDIARMPEEESYETMAGFMMYMLRRIPKLTDRVNYAGWRFEVIDVEGARVDQVRATRLKDLEVSEKVREQVVKEQKQAVAKTQQLSTPPADQKDLAPKKEDK